MQLMGQYRIIEGTFVMLSEFEVLIIEAGGLEYL